MRDANKTIRNLILSPVFDSSSVVSLCKSFWWTWTFLWIVFFPQLSSVLLFYLSQPGKNWVFQHVIKNSSGEWSKIDTHGWKVSDHCLFQLFFNILFCWPIHAQSPGKTKGEKWQCWVSWTHDNCLRENCTAHGNSLWKQARFKLYSLVAFLNSYFDRGKRLEILVIEMTFFISEQNLFHSCSGCRDPSERATGEPWLWLCVACSGGWAGWSVPSWRWIPVQVSPLPPSSPPQPLPIPLFILPALATDESYEKLVWSLLFVTSSATDEC